MQLKIKDVHIRYEDNVTVPGQVFALGVTIESLTAQSCDDKWMPRFVGWDSGNTSFKLMELSTLAVYWDELSEEQLLGGLSLGELAVSLVWATGGLSLKRRKIKLKFVQTLRLCT